MPQRSRLSRQRWCYTFVGVLMVFVLSLAVSCTDSSDTSPRSREATEAGLPGFPYLYGDETSLEERIARSDIIARVRLRSVSAAAYPRVGGLEYLSAMEHRFQALEYLKGSGNSELVAEVYDFRPHDTLQNATAHANALLAERDAQWDGREAIVFLVDDPRQNNRYVLGAAYTGQDNPFEKDYYSIASDNSKNWLPAASAGGASGRSSDGTQRFLLDAPQGTAGAGASGASGQSGTTPTIALTEMKAQIAAIEKEITDGGGSQSYRDCVYEKYRWEREIRYSKEARGGEYFYLRYDEGIASGLPAETSAYTSVFADNAVKAYGQALPTTNWGEYLLLGRDEDLFHPRWPGVAVTARPLPAAEYKFNYAYRPPEYVICEAFPEDELKRIEVFVTVTAPTGTVHEAFFDPVAIGTAVGADGTNGVLKPTAFTVGGVSTALQTLKWESSTLTLALSSAASLSGHALDFIALDGSVALSLAGGTTAAATHTWSVTDQPWQAGDLLMLRIRSGAPVATPTPTATPVPPAPPVFGSSTYAFSVAENAATGTAVGTVAATDANDDTVTYSVTAGNGDGAFAIDSASGAITVAGSLDRETTSSYTLTVQAADGNGGTGTATVTVTVTKANEAPVFGSDSYSFSVAETESAYSVIGTVAATDADGDAVTYWITAGNGSGTFSIDLNEGFVLIRKALDYETTTSYTLTVEARDGNGGVDSATVTITVTDVEGS